MINMLQAFFEQNKVGERVHCKNEFEKVCLLYNVQKSNSSF
jgi:hypothetical protein